jgi:subtilisin
MGYGVVLAVLLVGLVPTWLISGVMSAQALPAAQRGKEAVIVEVARGDSPQGVARALGVVPTRVYSEVFQGFAAELPPAAVSAAERQRGVRRIWPDLPVEAQDQKLPNGVNRVDADRNTWAEIHKDGGDIDADVAVLDTGIDPNHPDLTVSDGVDCSGPDTDAWTDGNGHGTHVAGTIAAKDNTKGVVGVAPGARLWAIKVLDNGGRGSWSEVICGLDWVAGNAATRGIKVINMSLSGEALPDDKNPCGPTTTPLHNAICQVVAAGVTVVVAAGNYGKDADSFVPATYDEAITVSAFKDLNGNPGGGGRSKKCGRRGDDTFAGFSNFGEDIDIAAPGVCIRSTWPGGEYKSLDGTSMAASHVTGAAALYIAKGPGPGTPADVRTWLESAFSRPNSSPYGFTRDPDAFDEGVLYLGPTSP